MASKLKNRLIKRFAHYGILVHPLKDHHFLSYLKESFLNEPSYRPVESRRITRHFLETASAQYYDVAKPHVFNYMKALSPVIRTITIPVRKRRTGRSRGLGFGRSGDCYYKVTDLSGQQVTPKRQLKARSFTNQHINESPFKQSAEKCSLPAIESCSSGAKYKLDLELPNQNMRLWKMMTPEKENSYPVRFSPTDTSDIALTLFQKQEISRSVSIRYIITREDVLNRIGEGRPCSQKKVMENYSAFEIFKAVGAIIDEHETGRDFHWAHRHGWGLGGLQEVTNLDAMTAAANYNTLFRVEEPIRHLLVDCGLEEIDVCCEVTYNLETNLPSLVKYTLNSGQENEMSIMVDPMSRRLPKDCETELSKSILSESYSSEQSSTSPMEELDDNLKNGLKEQGFFANKGTPLSKPDDLLDNQNPFSY